MEFMLNRCQATQKDGFVCRFYLGPGAVRCGIHKRVFETKGARKFVLDEIGFKKKRMIWHWRQMYANMHDIGILYRRICDWANIARATFRAMTDEGIADLLMRGGAWYIRGHPEPITEHGMVIEPIPLPLAIPEQQPGPELARFASDNQNVHRKATVDQTVEIVKRVMKIPVPQEYRWNMSTLSKTPGEIITCCKLTPLAGAAMIGKYSADDDIYELGNGIYGRVLDSVWQYISHSDDKESMCAILKQELQDNIGMCAQGNLSRLCNALAGYMEGIEDIESPVEKLGRLIPPLMDMEDTAARLDAVKKVLADVGLPTDQWDNWLTACA